MEKDFDITRNSLPRLSFHPLQPPNIAQMSTYNPSDDTPLTNTVDVDPLSSSGTASPSPEVNARAAFIASMNDALGINRGSGVDTDGSGRYASISGVINGIDDDPNELIMNSNIPSPRLASTIPNGSANISTFPPAFPSTAANYGQGYYHTDDEIYTNNLSSILRISCNCCSNTFICISNTISSIIERLKTSYQYDPVKFKKRTVAAFSTFMLLVLILVLFTSSGSNSGKAPAPAAPQVRESVSEGRSVRPERKLMNRFLILYS